jgi:hypothetical protein
VDGITLPPADAALHLNPLYVPEDGGFAIRWPSERYEAEYASQATYPLRSDGPEAIDWNGKPNTSDAARVRRREYVDLPERW